MTSKSAASEPPDIDSSPTVRAVSAIWIEREQVKLGPYGPDHDDDHPPHHLAKLAAMRLKQDFDTMTPQQQKRMWVEIGQFAVAGLERFYRGNV